LHFEKAAIKRAKNRELRVAERGLSLLSAVPAAMDILPALTVHRQLTA
jgi:hypothetical protein